MRISDWSSDVCSSDLVETGPAAEFERVCRVDGLLARINHAARQGERGREGQVPFDIGVGEHFGDADRVIAFVDAALGPAQPGVVEGQAGDDPKPVDRLAVQRDLDAAVRSEEHTSELQSLMRISYAVFCLKKKNTHDPQTKTL